MRSRWDAPSRAVASSAARQLDAARQRGACVCLNQPSTLGDMSIDVDTHPHSDVWQRLDPLWYTVVSSLLVMLGGVIVPVLGTVAGLSLVWFSQTWSRKDKWIATAIPVGIIVVTVCVVGVSMFWPIGSTGSAAPEGDVLNPLVPTGPYLLLIGLFVMIMVQFCVGVFLFWRATRIRSRLGADAA